MQKTVEQNSRWKNKVLISALISALFIFNGCLLTKVQGDSLTVRINKLEDEMAKIQSLKHDLEILLNDQLKVLLQKVATLDDQVANFKKTLEDSLLNNQKLTQELQKLSSEMEIAKYALEKTLEKTNVPTAEQKIVDQKKALITYKNLLKDNSQPKEETLLKIGLLLKEMGNTKAAMQAFEELISYKKDCEQAKEALKQITELKIHGNLTN